MHMLFWKRHVNGGAHFIKDNWVHVIAKLRKELSAEAFIYQPKQNTQAITHTPTAPAAKVLSRTHTLVRADKFVRVDKQN